MTSDTSDVKAKGKVAFCTLGCKLNFSETSTMGRTLRDAGYRPVRSGEKADLVLVNTCSVTEVADRKGRQAIHRLSRQHPGAPIIVTGCYAQLKSDEVAAIPGVSLVLGQYEKGRLLEFLDTLPQSVNSGNSLPAASETPASETSASEAFASDQATLKATALEQTTPAEKMAAVHVSPLWGKAAGPAVFVPSCSRGDRTRWWLKVQDGCDWFCSYCTIPYARGRSRNPSIDSLVRQAEDAAAQGAREIVITGVNIGDFGKSTGESFLDLVRALDGVEGISRYRISSLEPDLLDDALIDYVAGSRAFMPHFHIPLQSGSDEVLRLMRRRYDTALFAHKIERIKRVMPDAFIGVDVIVGTRGETEADFDATCRFLEGLDVTQLHVFSYSERPGTAALRIDGAVSPQEKHRRSDVLLALSEQKTHAFYAAHQGAEAEVLLEHPRPGMPFHGFTDNYIRVEVDAADSPVPLCDNTLLKVRMGDFNAAGDALVATALINEE